MDRIPSDRGKTRGNRRRTSAGGSNNFNLELEGELSSVSVAFAMLAIQEAQCHPSAPKCLAAAIVNELWGWKFETTRRCIIRVFGNSHLLAPNLPLNEES